MRGPRGVPWLELCWGAEGHRAGKCRAVVPYLPRGHRLQGHFCGCHGGRGSSPGITVLFLPQTWGPCLHHISLEIPGSRVCHLERHCLWVCILATCLTWFAQVTSLKAGDGASGPALKATVPTDWCLLVNPGAHTGLKVRLGRGLDGKREPS